jgi:hypothetical protein
MTSDDKFAAAAHLYVLLRRKSGRVIDTVWMAQNADYAREVIRVARAQSDAELARLADRFEALMFAEDDPTPTRPTDDAKYVRTLR